MYALHVRYEHAQSAVFQSNFFRDWSELLGRDHVVQELAKCDFSRITQHCLEQCEAKKALRMRHSVKEKHRADEATAKAIYGTAIVDGRAETVVNYRVAPPGLFRGRGKHPKAGTLRRRVQPEDVVLNVQPGTQIPPAPAGHQWKGVVHNQGVEWLARWRDNVNDTYQRMWLDRSRVRRQRKRLLFFTTARRLSKHIEAIRAGYLEQIAAAAAASPESDSSTLACQRAVAVYLIDRHGMYAGNEHQSQPPSFFKYPATPCCSLRVKDVSFPADNMVEFDICLSKPVVQVPTMVWTTLRNLCAGKSSRDSLVFDLLTVSDLQGYLGSLMDGLKAETFRTYNASVAWQKGLREYDAPPPDPNDNEHRANRRRWSEVARQVARLFPLCGPSTLGLYYPSADTRIMVAWCKRVGEDPEKFFPQHRSPPPWALEVSEDWEY